MACDPAEYDDLPLSRPQNMLYCRRVVLAERERERKGKWCNDRTLVTGASGDRVGADLNKPLTVPEADINSPPGMFNDSSQCV